MTKTLLAIATAAAAAACGAGSEAAPLETAPFDAPAEPERSPERLAALLAAYDGAAEGDRAALAAEIDRVAGQRYATVSRLFWHTDLDTALAEARARGVPVLSLRMLGRLDSDYSCANSRFFRVALYANAKVSALLRERFVLHVSSERPAPTITVDYGDGRVLRRTIAGNSAHYVLDARGRPVDVLPGLYGPETFMAELGEAAAVAAEVGGLGEAARAERLRAYHRAEQARLAEGYSRLGTAIRVIGMPGSSDYSLASAEMVTVTKAQIEMPVTSVVGLGEPFERLRYDQLMRERLAAAAGEQVRLDARSRALIASLAPADWAGGGRLQGAELEALIAAFERSIAADTALNQYGLRYRIHGWFADGSSLRSSLAALNERVYDRLFQTPKTDPWLGMAATGSFTGLPGSGLAR